MKRRVDDGAAQQLVDEDDFLGSHVEDRTEVILLVVERRRKLPLEESGLLRFGSGGSLGRHNVLVWMMKNEKATVLFTRTLQVSETDISRTSCSCKYGVSLKLLSS